MHATSTRSLLALLFALLLAVACSSDDGGGGGGGGSDDDSSSGADVQDSQDDLGEAEGSEPDTGDADDDASDTGSDAASDSTEVELPFSEAFIDRLCNRLCQRQDECGGASEGCHADCVAAVTAEPGYAKTIACWTDSVGACEAPAACTDIPDDADCVTKCEAATACGIFPDVYLGADAAECIVTCSAFMPRATDPEDQAILSCVYDAIDACDATALSACFIGGEDGICAEVCGLVSECGNMPALFADEATCISECTTWGAMPAMAAMVCADSGRDEDEQLPPEACAGQGACFPPPTEPAAGTDLFCAELMGLCGTSAELEIPDEQSCVWLMTGLGLRLAGADFAAGAECVAEMESCDDPFLVYGCLVPPYEPCLGFCEGLDACMPSPPPADWPGVEGCMLWCSQVHAQNPQAIDAAIACTDSAADCSAFMACLPESAQ